jgi:hypothetical protein
MVPADYIIGLEKNIPAEVSVSASVIVAAVVVHVVTLYIHSDVLWYTRCRAYN